MHMLMSRLCLDVEVVLWQVVLCLLQLPVSGIKGKVMRISIVTSLKVVIQVQNITLNKVFKIQFLALGTFGKQEKGQYQ